MPIAFSPTLLLLPFAAQMAAPSPVPAPEQVIAAPISPAPAPEVVADPAEERLHTDWAWIGRYAAANSTLPAPDPNTTRIVFLGDSITEGWPDKLPGFFAVGERVGRGIGGQTTPQMLVRFRHDVIALRPSVVHIMAGTNDIAGNTGPMDAGDTQAMIRSMVELAQANDITVILGSIPPADQYPWRPGLDTGERIRELNSWLEAYARESGIIYADYWNAMRDGNNLGMREGLSYDHVHPTEAGYVAMAAVAEPAIAAALALAFNRGEDSAAQ